MYKWSLCVHNRTFIVVQLQKVLRAGPPAQQGLAVSVFLHTEHANITLPGPAFFCKDQSYGKDLMIWISDHPDAEFMWRRKKKMCEINEAPLEPIRPCSYRTVGELPGIEDSGDCKPVSNPVCI